MDERAVRIEALESRIAQIEARTAHELDEVRAELHVLREGPSTPVQVQRPPERCVVCAAPVEPGAWFCRQCGAPRGATEAAAQTDRNEPLDLGWLTGPRGLALAGGVVTLLGIVLLFWLAASRGWIDPTVRCLIGGGVSALLLGAAIWIRQQTGRAAATLAAAGAGIGGLYVTLYAASRGYHLLGTGFVWVSVVAIAAAAATLALCWGSQLLSILGLVTAVVAPVFVEGRLNGFGIGASLVAATAALAIGQQRLWKWLGGIAYGLATVQAAVFVAAAHQQVDESFFTGVHSSTWPHRTVAAIIAGTTFALALAGSGAYQRRAARTDGLAAGLASVSLPFSLLSIWALAYSKTWDPATGGFRPDNLLLTAALLALAAAYAAPAVLLWRRKATHAVGELLAAFAAFAVALATAAEFSNGTLLTAWTLEGVVFAGLAVRLGHRRYQAASLAYLVAAAVHLLVFDVPPTRLFTEHAHPAHNVQAVLLVGAAAAASAWLLRRGTPLVRRLDAALTSAAGLLALYAASLWLLDLAQRLGGVDLHANFQHGETAVSALWALAALGLLTVGLVRRVSKLRYAGPTLLGLALAKLFLFDLSQLSSLARAGSFLIVGLVLLAGGFLVQKLAADHPDANGQVG